MIKSVLYTCIVIAGCAKTSLPLDKLQPVPTDRVQWRQPSAGQSGYLVIARDTGFSGGHARVLIAVDGQPAADIRDGEFLRLELEPGRRVLTASAFAALGGEIRRPRSLEVLVKVDSETLVRIGFDEMAGGFSIWQDVSK